MLLKIVYLLTCRVLGVAVLVFRGDRAKAAELLVLRHKNAVLRRHIGRVRYEPADGVWFRRAGAAPAQAGTRPPEINLAEYRIRRKQVLGGLTHEYQIAA